MLQRSALYLALMVAAIVGACSVLKKEDPAQGVRTFLSSFHSNLSSPDQEILKQFRVRQSPEAVLAVIRILKNQEKYLRCNAQFAEAQIFITGDDVRVTIPVQFMTYGLDNYVSEETTLELGLTAQDKSYTITRLEGEAFYTTFTQMKNDNEWGILGTTAVESRQPVYRKAQELESKFDTVIFYATYKNEDYFYVVDGEWQNYFLRHETRHEKNVDIKMGLANSLGEPVIPVEYDFIGTIAFAAPDLVEVKKEGKFGYFDLQSKTLIVEPKYEMIIPTEFDSVFAIVKQDSTFGWLTKYYEFRQGFPSPKVQSWFEAFTYLRKNLRLVPGNQVFCEIPSEDYAGNGIIMPPSYLVNHGVFDEIEHGIVTTKVPLHGYSEYKETHGSWIQRISDGFSALTTSIQERYLLGREEFYNTSTIVFIDNNYDTLGMTQLSGTDISMRAIDSTLLEVKTPHDWWFMEEGVCEESNLYVHAYFATTGQGSIKKLKSNRLFPETEFVKLDSSYITGKFLVYNSELEREDTTILLSLKTLTYMRDEILASNGFRFPDLESRERFNPDWYTPAYDNVSDLAEFLNPIDRHNLEFLEHIISALRPEEVVVDTESNI